MNLYKLLFFTVLGWGILFVWCLHNTMLNGHMTYEYNFQDPEIFSSTFAKLPKVSVPIGPLPKPKSETLERVAHSLEQTVWHSLTSEFKLDHQADRAQVQKEVKKILAEPDKFYKILEAASPYIYFILEQTQSLGLPAELALIPVIESEFNPNDYSSKGATGLWQIMRGTAHELGINVKGRYDGRRNVVVSTKAALAYFNDLGKNFKGNWYLAIAAYNSGQGKVESAVRRAGTRLFWDLALPRETKYYLPKLLAVAAIVKNPKKYGIELPPILNQPYFVEVKTKKSVSLERVADISGAAIAALRRLNPDYKNGAVLPKNGTYSLLVPINVLPQVQSHFSDIIISR